MTPDGSSLTTRTEVGDVEQTGRSSDGYLWPTVDVLLALLGIGFVTYPLAHAVLSLVPAPFLSPGLATVVVAFGGAYPVVAGPWSLGRLGDYVLVWVAAVLCLSVAAFPVAVLLGGLVGRAVAASQVAIFGLAHLAAMAAVGPYGLAPTRQV